MGKRFDPCFLRRPFAFNPTVYGGIEYRLALACLALFQDPSDNNDMENALSGITFGQNMLSELRLVAIPFGNNQITDQLLQKAVTANEELQLLGYTLTAADIVQLAASPALDSFCEYFRTLIGDVKAKPMYPDFPHQVMEMDEAQFRFDQMLHYFSTYGIEMLTGAEVSKGWLPNVKETKKSAPDEKLLEAKVIHLVSRDDQYLRCAKIILEKQERVTDKEKRILQTAFLHIPAEDIVQLKIPFKENLMMAFYEIFKNEESPHRLAQLHALCSHTGDVLKCMNYALTREHYHFRTSQKRLLTKLLESYSVVDFKTNLILSRKKGERNKLLLDFISFGTFSRSTAHKKAAEDLRSGKLRSWESQAKYLLAFDKEEALAFIAQRPGTMLRLIAWLIRLGYSADEIELHLLEKADKLNPQTMITILTEFGKDLEDNSRTLEEQRRVSQKRSERESVFLIVRNLLKHYLMSHPTRLDGKKVRFDPGSCAPEHSVMQFNNRSEEGGYIRSGLAYRIPDEVKRLRFFLYWNDKKRVDCDLHAAAYENGRITHIGWNGDYNRCCFIYSGDITHSDAAEYIDIDMTRFHGKVSLNVNLFSGYWSFGEIETCYCGMLAVESIEDSTKLYNAQNCFFCHFLTGKARTLQYGFIDTTNRCLVFEGVEQNGGWYVLCPNPYSRFNLKAYLDLLFEARNVEIVEDPEAADLIVVMGKSSSEKEISLIDHNFFLESPDNNDRK